MAALLLELPVDALATILSLYPGATDSLRATCRRLAQALTSLRAQNRTLTGARLWVCEVRQLQRGGCSYSSLRIDSKLTHLRLIHFIFSLDCMQRWQFT